MLPEDRDNQAGEGEDEQVRRRAYDIWEREGRPHGRDEEHWRLARQEIANESRGARGSQTVPAARVGAPGKARPQQSDASARPVSPLERSSGTQADPLGLVQGESAGSGAGMSDQMIENTTTPARPSAKAKPRTAKPRASRAKKPAGESGTQDGSDRQR